jgi:hypothetical protein
MPISILDSVYILGYCRAVFSYFKIDGPRKHNAARPCNLVGLMLPAGDARFTYAMLLRAYYGMHMFSHAYRQTFWPNVQCWASKVLIV